MKSRNQTLILILAAGVLLVSQRAMAATCNGAGALNLASVIAAHSPVLSPAEKHVMAQFFDGHRNVAFPATKKISIRADLVDCKEGDVDITKSICMLTFGAKNVILTGHAAHEVYGTLAQLGVVQEGAAGSLEETLSNVVCTINPHAIAQMDGERADCSFHATLVRGCRMGSN